jgi:hypothetical protein
MKKKKKKNEKEKEKKTCAIMIKVNITMELITTKKGLFYLRFKGNFPIGSFLH